MRKGDIEPERTSRPPDSSKVIMGTEMQNQGFMISRVELRQYVEETDEQLGEYSLLTVLVETDKGSAEMKYDEGFLGPDALESAATMLTKYVGLASLINRALIELQS
jgi:hypothetical protein